MLTMTMVYYNFCRKHLSLKGQTPAMAAGLTEYRGGLPTCFHWTCGGRRRPPSGKLVDQFTRKESRSWMS
jgi:hypothetical protein